MRSLRDLAGHELEWRRVGWFPSAWELRNDQEVVAELTLEGPFSDRVLGRCADGTWRFRGSRIFQLKTVVESPQTGEELARLEQGFTGRGTLRLRDGTLFEWRRPEMITRAWGFFDTYGSALVRFVPQLAFGRMNGRCVIEPAGAARAELPMLALLGLHMTLRRLRRRAVQ